MENNKKDNKRKAFIRKEKSSMKKLIEKKGVEKVQLWSPSLLISALFIKVISWVSDREKDTRSCTHECYLTAFTSWIRFVWVLRLNNLFKLRLLFWYWPSLHYWGFGCTHRSPNILFSVLQERVEMVGTLSTISTFFWRTSCYQAN